MDCYYSQQDISVFYQRQCNLVIYLYHSGLAWGSVSVIKTRVRATSETGDTDTEMVSHHIQMKLPATTRHYRFFSDDRDLGTHGHGKESLTETSTPGFISTVSPDLSQPTHRLKEEDIKVNVGDSPRLRSQDDVSQ